MNRLLLTLAIAGTIGSLLLSNQAAGQIVPPAKKAARVAIIKGPELELSSEVFPIIPSTTNNPGWSNHHLGGVYDGTDPKDLSQTAKSPIRLNQKHPTAP